MASKTLAYKSLYNPYKTVTLYILMLSIRVGDDGLIYENKKLAVSGIASVLVASLIIASIATAPWCRPAKSGSPGSLPDFRFSPISPIIVRLTTSGFTKPRGIGSQGLLSINVTSSVNASNVILQISISKAYEDWSSKGIELVGGATTWDVHLLANVPVIVNIPINATEVGYCRIVAEATWYDSSSNYEYYSADQLGIVVFEDEILVVEDLGGNLPYLFPPDFQPPIWPEPTDLNWTIPMPPMPYPLIIASVVMASWSRPATSTPPSSTSPDFPPEYQVWPLDMVTLFISNFTEPIGVGSEAVLTVIVASPYNVTNVTVRLDLLQVVDDWPVGIISIGGHSTMWNGDLRANRSISFNAKIKAIEAGYARIVANATWYNDLEECYMELLDSLWIIVLENDIQVSHKPMMPPGSLVPFPVVNAT